MQRRGVPVLSEHRIVMPASSSMADRRATMTLASARRLDPTASVDVHTISMAMGMDATRMTMQFDSAVTTLAGSFFLGTGVIVGLSDDTISLICTQHDTHSPQGTTQRQQPPRTKMTPVRRKDATRRASVMFNTIFWKRPTLSTLLIRSAALPKNVKRPAHSEWRR